MKRYIRANTASPFIYDGTQKVPKDVTKIIVAEGVTGIYDDAFHGCKSLVSVLIPPGVKIIGAHSFAGCDSLKSITLPKSLEIICDYAFRGCTSLKSITIPQGVTIIRRSAFSDCSSLESITIPSSVTSIRSFAFSSCISLERITLPDSVALIDYCAFSNCTSLTNVTVLNAEVRIDSQAFYNCDSLAQIILPDEVIDLGGSRNNMSDEAEPGSFAYKQKQLEEFEIDWDDIEDDFYQDFCDAAYQIVENEGYTDVFTEPSTQSGVGDDFFTAYLNGERYSGSFNFVDEQDCLEEIYLNSDSYEEACDRAAKWYARVILENLEPDEE